MKTVALKLDDNDIKAVAMYYSRLRELETQAKHASAAPIQTGQNR
jgi:cytochrome c553